MLDVRNKPGVAPQTLHVVFALIASSLVACAVGVTEEEPFGNSSENVNPSDEDAGDDTPIDEPIDEPVDSGAIQPTFDAGGGVRDAGPDAGSTARDAGSDAALDAGRDAGPTTTDAGLDAGRDAGQSTAQDAGRDAGRDAGQQDSGGGTNMCNPDRCTNNCGIDAPFRCCESNGTCGCSWFSLAYCN